LGENRFEVLMKFSKKVWIGNFQQVTTENQNLSAPQATNHSKVQTEENLLALFRFARSFLVMEKNYFFGHFSKAWLQKRKIHFPPWPGMIL